MKWSEQMRELISVDENFNQLQYDINTQILTINGEFIAKAVFKPVTETTSTYVVNYEDYNKIIKKYPFFTDLKFLLNCIFKTDFYFSKAGELYYYENYILIQNSKSEDSVVIYIAPQE